MSTTESEGISQEVPRRTSGGLGSASARPRADPEDRLNQQVASVAQPVCTSSSTVTQETCVAARSGIPSVLPADPYRSSRDSMSPSKL